MFTIVIFTKGRWRGVVYNIIWLHHNNINNNMNYNIRTFFIYLYTVCHWRNGPGSTVVNGQLLCSSAIILRKIKKYLRTTIWRQIIIQLGTFEMFTLFIIQIRNNGVTIVIMVPTYVMNHFFFNRPNFLKKI